MQSQSDPQVQVAENEAPPKDANELHVLYFFGGNERHSDLRKALLEALETAKKGVTLRLDEIDVLQQPGFDVTKGEVQKLYLASVKVWALGFGGCVATDWEFFAGGLCRPHACEAD